MPVTIRAFSDAPINFGGIGLTFSLEEGEFDMGRLQTSGIPFQFSHMPEKLGEIVGYSVMRPDPEGEGTAAMYLVAELSADSDLTADGLVYKRQLESGAMRATSAGWSLSRADLVFSDPPEGDGEYFIMARAVGWDLVEDSAVYTPRVESARVISVTASADGSGLLSEGQVASLRARVEAHRREAKEMAENQAAASPQTSLTPELQAALEEMVRAGLAASVAPAAPAAGAVTVTPAPAVPPSMAEAAQFAQFRAWQEAQAQEQASAQAGADGPDPLAQAYRNKFASVNVHPQTIEQAAQEPGQRYHLGAALCFAGIGGAAMPSERDFAKTVLRMKETADRAGQAGPEGLLFPGASGRPHLLTTRADLWPQLQANVATTNVVQQVTRTELTPDPDVEGFPYKMMLDVRQATGEVWVPVVETALSAHEVAEGSSATESNYATTKSVLTPQAANVYVKVNKQSFFLSPGLDGEIRYEAARRMNANDQKWIETTFHATTASQGLMKVPGSDKVVIGAVGANVERSVFLDAEKHLAAAIKQSGYGYFFILGGDAYSAARNTKVDSGSGLFVINGDMNMGRVGTSDPMIPGPMVYRTGNLGDREGVLIPGRLYKYCEWQGVMVTVDPYTAKDSNVIEYCFDTYRDGVAIYTAAFPYFEDA